MTVVRRRRAALLVALDHEARAVLQGLAPRRLDRGVEVRVRRTGGGDEAVRPEPVEVWSDVEPAAAVALGEAGQFAARHAALLALNRVRDDVERVREYPKLPLHVRALELLAHLARGAQEPVVELGDETGLGEAAVQARE